MNQMQPTIHLSRTLGPVNTFSSGIGFLKLLGLRSLLYYLFSAYSSFTIKFADKRPCFEYVKPLPLMIVVKSFSDPAILSFDLKYS